MKAIPLDNTRLLTAAWITLGRSPVTPGALSLTSAVFDHLLPHLSGENSRPIGTKSALSLRSDIGIILAGIMQPRKRLVSAQRGHSAGIWKDQQRVGHDRFWRIVDALEAAGLVGVRLGTKANALGQQIGYPTRIWATAALEAIAEPHGVTEDTRKADWSLDTLQVAKPATRRRGVVVEPFKDVAIGPVDERRLAHAEAALADLNALNAAAVIRGAGETITLYRKFRHTLDFHGRHYGADYINVSPAERLAITFDGDAAAEVDVKAAHLSLVCALAGVAGPNGELPWPDPYAFPGLPRKAVKEWTLRTLGRGTAKWGRMSWNPNDLPEVRATPVRAVKAAMLGRYSFMGDLEGLVTPGALPEFPSAKDRAKGVGQWITGREAAIIAAALSYCVARGCPVLPVHDSLIVPVSRVRDAKDGLMGAYYTMAGLTPRLTVDVAGQDASSGS